MAMDTGICITCGAEDEILDSTEQCVDCEEAVLAGLEDDSDDLSDDPFGAISLDEVSEGEEMEDEDEM